MTKKEWLDLDIDQLELLDVTETEKARVKRHVLKKRGKTPILRRFAAASSIFIGAAAATGFAFPSLASQLPFMDNVIQFFSDEEARYTNFEDFSSDINLSQTSNGITVMIDNAVYDGTNITVSYALETEHDFGEAMKVKAPYWFDVAGAIGSGGGDQITRISNTRYVGLATFTPHFKDDAYPETVKITWSPKAFTSMSNNLEIEGDWSFDFSLERLEGDLLLVNRTVEQEDVNFTLQTIEFTDVSTIITYEQTVSDELLAKWPSATPIFRITDNLGNVYVDESSGGGVSKNNGKTFNGTTDFGTIQSGASQLIIQPVEIVSELSGEGHIEIELEPIVIDLKK
ncbi:DUF4179 domain-containing protein [Ureibacillus aquaedulcis]|uniref:DUF4179 domain-containing protein n=1 Tax=Ureibacillus aquaedulcis TaxID=3058421 RepID=A0ABT8GKI8_9BACL|nr:DUF4179 domain-containing protein [Ureibacillus sp. BA0131]MDN4491930.1 DUF4179 domain-containing protein [Ureibacillus sp. BA0131]